MQIKPKTDDLQVFLLSSATVDFDDPENSAIRELADEIENMSADRITYIKNAYEYVRDKISHSADIGNDKVTCSASEVLKEKHGICFAKSHLLAALLRYKGIPAGFCYQKLILNDELSPVLVYHGLNGVYIEDCKKWIRLDARGNKDGVSAEFSVEEERLAFPVRIEKGELDVPIIFDEPDQKILEALTENKTRTQLWDNLPAKLLAE